MPRLRAECRDDSLQGPGWFLQSRAPPRLRHLHPRQWDQLHPARRHRGTALHHGHALRRRAADLDVVGRSLAQRTGRGAMRRAGMKTMARCEGSTEMPMRRDQSGFTLIEAMIAVIILIFGLVGIAQLLAAAAASNSTANRS